MQEAHEHATGVHTADGQFLPSPGCREYFLILEAEGEQLKSSHNKSMPRAQTCGFDPNIAVRIGEAATPGPADDCNDFDAALEEAIDWRSECERDEKMSDE